MEYSDKYVGDFQNIVYVIYSENEIIYNVMLN